MSGKADTILRFCAGLLAAALFLPEATTVTRPGAASTARFREAYFHGGKTASAVPPSAGCLTAGCHRSASHPRRRPESAFLNMHEPVVSCLGCHGKDPEGRWASPDPAGAERSFRVVYSHAVTGGDPHGGTAPPARCPRCHSGSGLETLSAAGVKGLPQGFESPIPLRMLEGEGRKWLTEDIR